MCLLCGLLGLCLVVFWCGVMCLFVLMILCVLCVVVVCVVVL